MSDVLVWLRGVEEPALGALEWWRVVAVRPTGGSRLLSVKESEADSFARLLVSDRWESGPVEHWRDGE